MKQIPQKKKNPIKPKIETLNQKSKQKKFKNLLLGGLGFVETLSHFFSTTKHKNSNHNELRQHSPPQPPTLSKLFSLTFSLINQPKINTNPQKQTQEPKPTDLNKPPKIRSFQTLNNHQSNKSPNPQKIKQTMGKEGDFQTKTKQKNKEKMK
ncbi:hypothetical protein ACB098_09G051800 [Castanea mollissima]